MPKPSQKPSMQRITVVNSFGRPAIGPSRDGNVCAQQFVPVFLPLLFVLFGMSDSARPVTRISGRMSSNATVKQSLRKFDSRPA